MTRHVLDHRSDQESAARMREYARLERESGRHPASSELHRRPVESRGLGRLKHYLRIDRGRTES